MDGIKEIYFPYLISDSEVDTCWYWFSDNEIKADVSWIRLTFPSPQAREMACEPLGNTNVLLLLLRATDDGLTLQPGC